MNEYCFYVHSADSLGNSDDISYDGFTCQLWRPSYFSIMPSDLRNPAFFVWWLFHKTHLFANQEYGVMLVRNADGEIAHRSTITPKYFRFPFMSANDLQIGDVWTSQKFRGKGLAFLALKKIIKAYTSDNRILWYVVEEKNEASIKLAVKAGFELFGHGERNKSIGIKLLGKFEITSKCGAFS
jgi:RimJ/RimL family protein N-acetyltransferase